MGKGLVRVAIVRGENGESLTSFPGDATWRKIIVR